jgi:ABC-type phosphate transport system auxiliary subunit
MEQAGSLKNLAERMREKAEQERIETEKVFKEQLQTLKDNLQASSQNALSTMSDAMGQEITSAAEKLKQHYQVLSMAFGRKWIVLASLGAALCIGVTISAWALTEIWARRLIDHLNERAQLKEETRTLRRELEVLRPERARAETWGLSFQERSKGRFIVVPPGMKIVTGWTVDEQQAIKLE